MSQAPGWEKFLGEGNRRQTNKLSVRQRQTLDALVASLNLDMGQTVPDDHPLKAFLDASDPNMTVKEALAKTFPDYRVRHNNNYNNNKRTAPAKSPVKRKKRRLSRRIQKANDDVERANGDNESLRMDPERIEPIKSPLKLIKINLNPPGDVAFPSASEGLLNRIQELAMVIKSANPDATVDILAGDFGVSRQIVNKVLAGRQLILQNTARVLVECVIDDTTSVRNDEHTVSKRRGPFFGLNILVWKLFEECSQASVQLSPKLIRDYALLMSRQLGLTNFKGSDGWYEAFKKRHKITWFPMRGISSITEEDREDLVVEMKELLKKLDGDDDDDMIEFREVDDESNGNVSPDRVVALEQASLEFPDIEVVVNNAQEENEDDELIDLPIISDNQAMVNRSSSIYIPDPEVSYYIGILRGCIVSRNPALLPQLLQIQELIVQILDGIAPHARHNNANLPPRRQMQEQGGAAQEPNAPRQEEPRPE